MTEREYNNCVREYADGVYRFVLKNLRLKEDAEDVVQSAFEVLWEQRSNVKNETVKSFLFTIAYRKMIDWIRKNKRISFVDTPEKFDQRSTEQKSGLRSALDEALERLDDTKKSLVLLKDYEGYNYEEIGRITGLNESQVKVYLHRARLQLREYLVKVDNVL
ncbi:MAG TPA: RNA polymerase sigma factor [Niabella sp.]|nr:RNA polymerase sigma factor [Niabella sp.]HQW15260.1 RNA polymerase sigma factor [Niabella sp.]HQX20490.1 RNA polymerase sigma factor [Niabella sp.]HQX42573.1 RNA polymerase sigma factor [Niabella sp.]HRB06885.1 RNA polymerase sigma factor [Niabella sp.]